MAISILSNVQAQKAQRYLADAGISLAARLEKISSGQRINRASDDAAGLAISENLKVNSRILQQGIRNFNDGISFLNIAQGALGNLQEISARQSELAEQSANGVYSSKQRAALNKEAGALTNEFNRVVQTAEFNGISVIDVSQNATGIRFQAGIGLENSLAFVAGDELARTVGNGTYATGTAVNAFGAATSSVKADFNLDGIEDIALQGGNALVISLSPGSGSLTVSQSIALPTRNVNLAVGDINGDGYADLAYGDPGIGIFTFINDRNGSFSAGTTYTDAGISSAIKIEINDFNGDGKGDLLYTRHTTNDLVVALNTGSNAFAVSNVKNIPGSIRSLTTGDFDSDGIADVMVNQWTSTNSYVYLGDSSGGLNLRQTLTTISGANSGTNRGAVAKDLNGDGILDVAMVSEVGGTVQALFGTGNGSFVAGASYSVGASATNIRVEDIDGDGANDIITYSGGTNTLRFLRNSGSGTFTEVFSQGVTGSSFEIVDLNRDGALDSLRINSSGSAALAQTTKSSIVLSVDLSSRDSARSAISSLALQRTRISNEIGRVGSLQSRFQAALGQLGSAQVGYQEAASRILSADIAEESAQAQRLEILQQTASAVLAQSKLAPQLALTLLRDI